MDSDAIRRDLDERLAKRDVLAVVGSGLSIAATGGATVASWTGLLHDGVRHCQDVRSLDNEWAQRTHAEIDSGDLDDLLSAAEKIARKLGAPQGPEFQRWLESTVGALTPESTEVLDALGRLALPIVTTNYDGLIESVTRREPITWMDLGRVQRALRYDEDAVIHLHGFWRRPESVVLGIRSYEEIRHDNVQALLQAMASMKCLLFIGCGGGLEDPNFGALRGWMASVHAHSPYRHFRLYCDAEKELLEVHHENERVFGVRYGQHHGELAPFLRRLAETTRAIAFTSAPEIKSDQGPGRNAADSVVESVSTVLGAELTVLANVKDRIGADLYDEQRREVLKRSLSEVRQLLRERRT